MHMGSGIGSGPTSAGALRFDSSSHNLWLVIYLLTPEGREGDILAMTG